MLSDIRCTSRWLSLDNTLLLCFLLITCLPKVSCAQSGILSTGNNNVGQLGDGKDTLRSRFAPTSSLANVTTLVSGAFWGHALRGDDTAWSWGNGGPAIGDKLGGYRAAPVQVERMSETSYLSDVIVISAGINHTVAARSDGTVWAWGDNTYGQLGIGTAGSVSLTPVQVRGPSGAVLTDVVTVAAGHYHSLALKSNGTVWAWGDNTQGQLGDGTNVTKSLPVRVVGLGGVIAIASGRIHNLALTSEGTVWAWGYNAWGQLGDGSTSDRSRPIQVVGLTGVVAISATSTHSLALTAEGSVWAWGNNNSGQLGDNTRIERHTPVRVRDLMDPSGILTRIVAITAAYCDATNGSSLALKADGTVRAWGDNVADILSIGSDVNSTTARRVLDPFDSTGYLTDIIGISGSCAGALTALKASEIPWTWGKFLGDGSLLDVNRYSPAPVSSLTGTIAICAGDKHNLALRSDGHVWAWGLNDFGQLGDATNGNRYAPYIRYGAQGSGLLTNIVTIAAGTFHSLAVRADGTVWAWGQNLAGALGDNTTSDHNLPVQVKGVNGTGTLTNVTLVAAGNGYSLARKSDGTVWAWGINGTGQLGDNTLNPRLTPVQVKGTNNVGFLNNATALACGYNHCLALKSDGTVWAWGYNGYGQLGDNTYSNRRTPVQVKGVNGSGFLTSVVAIACGSYHSIALKQDGTVWTWGNNADGHLGNNILGGDRQTPGQVRGAGGVGFLTGITNIAAGRDFCMARKSDGTLWGWGQNTDGQLGDNTITNHPAPVQAVDLADPTGFLHGIVGVAAGGAHSLALLPPTATVSGHITLTGSLRQIGELVTLEFRPTNGDQPFMQKVRIGADGAFAVSALPRKNYNVWIKGRKWVSRVVVANAVQGDVNDVNAILPGGDSNGDNSVDVLDLDILIQAFDSTVGDYQWSEQADLNGDYFVDVLDLDVLIQNFDQSGDP